MPKTAKILSTSVALAAQAAFAADIESQTVISGGGPALLVFALAGALLLTLLLRTTAQHAARFVTTQIGRRRIRRALERRSADVLHDFVLPGANGGIVNIDHAILTAGGILCIQCVHCNGTIFGDKEEAQWTSVDGVRRRRFLNPLIRNEGRSRALRKVVPAVPVANLVIFTGAVEFTRQPPRNVIHVRRLESFIAKFVFGPSKVKDWDAVWLSVKAAAIREPAAHRKSDVPLTTH